MRVRLRGECPGSGRPRRPHFPGYDGLSGCIDGVYATKPDGHVYLVDFDDVPAAGFYARVELERHGPSEPRTTATQRGI